MAFCKPQGKLTFAYKFHLDSSKQYQSHVQLPIRSKRKISILLHAKSQQEDEPECNSWKMHAFYVTLNSVHQKLSANPDVINAYSRPGKSNEIFVEEVMATNHILPELSANHLVSLFEKMKALHLHLLAAEHWNASVLKLCHRNYLASAINLTHYLALSSLNLQELQVDLSSAGFLTIENINSHVLASIAASVQLLHHLSSKASDSNDSATYLDRNGYTSLPEKENSVIWAINDVKKRAAVHVAALLGEEKTGHIMVTVGREAVKDKMLIESLLKSGTNLIRINCAHDDPTVWSELVRITKHSSQLLEKPCRILMDLSGPKLRTKVLRTYSNIVKLSPKKDFHGNVVFPAQIWLCSDNGNPPADLSTKVIIWIENKFYDKLRTGDYLNFIDVRGKKRLLKVLKMHALPAEHGCAAECLQTSYIKMDTELSVKDKRRDFSGRVIKVTTNAQSVRLKVGDLFTIIRSSSSHLDKFDNADLGSVTATCSSDHIFDCIKQEDRIIFDDGKISGKVREVNADWATIMVTRASPKGSKLGSGKSINIPESELQPKGLTSKDLADLNFVGDNADMVGISFVRDAADIVIVQNELKRRNFPKLGIVLKIETLDGLESLPSLLFQAMKGSNPLGVMVARGDLMVECGWDRMGFIQEKILAICCAAHIPVIWATGVLVSLVKFGFPTRAEITDVFSGMRANCIMLNKGEKIVEAVAALKILLRNSR